LLALLAGFLQLAQVRLNTPPVDAGAGGTGLSGAVTYLFPLVTVAWGGILPSGLLVYWVAYTTFLVVHQCIIAGSGPAATVAGWRSTVGRLLPASAAAAPSGPSLQAVVMTERGEAPEALGPAPSGSARRSTRRRRRRRGQAIKRRA
jgi:hypothetical protein